MSQFLLLLAALLPAADGPMFSGTVRAKGAPVAGATVWVRMYARQGQAESAPTTTDAQGRFTLPLTEAVMSGRPYVIARDPAGRIGWQILYWARDLGLEPALRVDLYDVGEARGRVLDADGRPIAGAKVQAYALEEPSTGGESRSTIQITPSLGSHYETKTVADGFFVLSGIPVGSKYAVDLTAPGHGSMKVIAPQAQPCEFRLPQAGRARVRFRGADDPAKLVGLVLNLSAREQRGEVLTIVGKEATAGASDTLDINDLPAGRYQLSVRSPEQVPYVAPADSRRPIELTVPAGGLAEATVELQLAALVRGRLVNKVTGAGIPGIDLYLAEISEKGAASIHSQVVTDAEGRFAGHVPSGRLGIMQVRSGSGLVDFLPPTGYWVKPAEVAAGATHTFPDISLEPAVAIDGVVHDAAGQPVPGVWVHAAHVIPNEQPTTITDAQGRFTLRGLGKDETTALRVRTARAATDGGVLVDVAERTGPVRLTVTEAAASRLRGVVVDTAGQPIADAAVRIESRFRGVGRSAQYGFGSWLETHRTDADGRFETQALWPGDQYRAQLTADGFGQAESARITAKAGQVHDLGRIVMTRTGGIVAGRVVDADDKPLAGVRVANSGDAPKPLEATTDADGRFRLTGFFDGPVYLTARRDGYRFTLHRTRSGDAAAVIRMPKAGDPPPAGAAPQPAADYEAAVRKLTRDLQEKLWRLPRNVTNGYERRIWEWTFRTDPELARRWLVEERERGTEAAATVLFANNLRQIAEVEKAAAGDVEDALAKLEPLKPHAAFDVLLKLARHYQPTDPAKALRLAEEAILRARAVELPDRAWCLADVTELVAKLGRDDSARKLIAEVATVAESLGTERMQGYGRGRVAAVLATYDPPRARKLIEPIAEENERKRWLAAMTVRLAARDPAQAPDLIKQLRPDRSTLPDNTQRNIAYHLAATHPAEAVRLAETIDTVWVRIPALAGVAVRVAPRDPALARSLIDRALAQLTDRDRRNELTSWSGMGGDNALTAWVVYQAQRANHPDLDAVIAHVWATRPTNGLGNSPSDRTDQVVKAAALLALVDPVTAHALLDSVLPPGRPLPGEVAGRREGMFALALADPARAVGLIDQKIEAAKKSKDGISGTGLIELLDILTTPAEERVHTLTMFASMYRERDDD
jgi:uncharacterized GH25 family protein